MAVLGANGIGISSECNPAPDCWPCRSTSQHRAMPSGRRKVLCAFIRGTIAFYFKHCF